MFYPQALVKTCSWYFQSSPFRREGWKTFLKMSGWRSWVTVRNCSRFDLMLVFSRLFLFSRQQCYGTFNMFLIILFPSSGSVLEGTRKVNSKRDLFGFSLLVRWPWIFFCNQSSRRHKLVFSTPFKILGPTPLLCSTSERDCRTGGQRRKILS